jgi:hypothetical protein
MCSQNSFRFTLLLSLVLTMIVGCTTLPQREISLFDGESLTGWRSLDDAKWWVADGSILLQSGEDGYLVSDAVFDQYRLSVEFWVDRQVNSGVFVHCSNPADISPLTCYEINIWDDHPRQEYRTGAIVTQVRPKAVLDDVEVSRLERPEKQAGHIALQRANGGEVRFRHISLQPI